MDFILKPEWMLEDPVDAEHKKYRILHLKQQMEADFKKGELYPSFTELTFHFLNAFTFQQKESLFTIEDKLTSHDHEIAIDDLIPMDIKEVSEEEMVVVRNVTDFFIEEMRDSLQNAKGIWEMTYDSIEINILRNSHNLSATTGFILHFNENDGKSYMWQYERKENSLSTTLINTKKGRYKRVTLKGLTSLGESEVRSAPIVEFTSNDMLSLEKSILPVLKRKLASLIWWRLHPVAPPSK